MTSQETEWQNISLHCLKEHYLRMHIPLSPGSDKRETQYKNLDPDEATSRPHLVWTYNPDLTNSFWVTHADIAQNHKDNFEFAITTILEKTEPWADPPSMKMWPWPLVLSYDCWQTDQRTRRGLGDEAKIHNITIIQGIGIQVVLTGKNVSLYRLNGVAVAPLKYYDSVETGVSRDYKLSDLREATQYFSDFQSDNSSSANWSKYTLFTDC